MKFLFGPVPSRRLGQSLGIDPVPLKTCNWNCIYCQLGRSTSMVNVRREYSPREEVVAEFEQALAGNPTSEVDFVTFVGSGETTLHSSIGWMIEQVKKRTHLPVAVITNGSLLYMPEVRMELATADAVLPSLDAGNAKLYRRLNRPHAALSYERFVDGLVAFRNEYRGKLWVEVMLLEGFNDTELALGEIAAMLRSICPDQVHLVRPDRPAAEFCVRPPSAETLERSRAMLGSVAKVVCPADGCFNVSNGASPIEAVLSIIARHPMREDELLCTLRQWHPDAHTDLLMRLEEGGKAQVVERHGIRFWSASGARYPTAAPVPEEEPG